jgi:hypothetical protein
MDFLHYLFDAAGAEATAFTPAGTEGAEEAGTGCGSAYAGGATGLSQA